MDSFRIDSHKLMFHVGRVNDWLEGKLVYPIYIEITPCGACNHRCIFCAVDYIGYKVRFLDTGMLKERISEMAEKGVKSVMYAGEGEPLLHKQIGEIVRHTKKAGIDAAITTNAVPLTEKFCEEALDSITWMKASINAGTPQTYAKIHRTRADQFDQALENLRTAVRTRARKGIRCTLGVQMILLPENQDEAALLAQRAKDAGVDYIVIKPYSQHHYSVTRRYEDIRYDRCEALKEELMKYNSEDFEVVFREYTMKKLSQSDRRYKVCQATPYFWAYVMGNGDVYGCSAYLQDERFLYGNLYQNTFAQIWEGEKRKESIRYIANELNIDECRTNCRMDEVNKYLWELRHASPHVNFI